MISINARLLEYCTKKGGDTQNSEHDTGLSVAEYKTSWPWAGKLVCGCLDMFRGFPGGSDLQFRRTDFDPWVRQISWRRERLPAPVFLPGDVHGQRNLVGYSPWGHRESNPT